MIITAPGRGIASWAPWLHTPSVESRAGRRASADTPGRVFAPQAHENAPSREIASGGGVLIAGCENSRDSMLSWNHPVLPKRKVMLMERSDSVRELVGGRGVLLSGGTCCQAFEGRNTFPTEGRRPRLPCVPGRAELMLTGLGPRLGEPGTYRF